MFSQQYRTRMHSNLFSKFDWHNDHAITITTDDIAGTDLYPATANGGLNLHRLNTTGNNRAPARPGNISGSAEESTRLYRDSTHP